MAEQFADGDGSAFAAGAVLDGVEDIKSRFRINEGDITSYLNEGEELTGFGKGGSESLVLFVDSQAIGAPVVRKVCSEELVSVEWDPKGSGVMAPPSLKARYQVDYLQKLPDEVRPYFPVIHGVRELAVAPTEGTDDQKRKFVSDQSYVPGVEVSSFVEEHQPSPKVVAHLHREILRCLREKVHTHRRTENNDPTIEASYLDKITDRLAISQKAAPETFTPLIAGDSIVINGERYRNISPLLEWFRSPAILDVLEPRYHSLVMGDTNTENVKITEPDTLLTVMREGHNDFTYDDLGIMFIDPRAIGHNSVGGETVDDYMYDNKPVHNSLGNYDTIHGEHFQLHPDVVNGEVRINMRPTEDNPFREPYRDMAKDFAYVMEGWDIKSDEFLRDDPNWLVRFAFMMGTHFAAMPPFHFKKDPEGVVQEDWQEQKRAVAVYCEGIKWLNLAQDMMSGKVKEFCGVQVPSLQISKH